MPLKQSKHKVGTSQNIPIDFESLCYKYLETENIFVSIKEIKGKFGRI